MSLMKLQPKNGLPIVVSGPSGVGKGTILKKVLPKLNDVKLSISMTTRSPRPGEEDGVNYFFVNEDRFINAIHNHELLEWAQVHGNFYGTPLAQIHEHLINGFDVLLEIDVQGAASTRSLFQDSLLVFIVPPSLETLKERLIGRAKSADDNLEIRYNNALKEMQYLNIFDYIIVNDDLDQAVNELTQLINVHRLSKNRMLPRMVDLGLINRYD